MIDKLGYISEIDVIESLSSSSGKGFGGPDRKTQEGSDFRDVLASEMSAEGKSSACAENQRSALPSTYKSPNCQEGKQEYRPHLDDARNEESSRVPSEETNPGLGEESAQKDGDLGIPNQVTSKIPAKKAGNQANAGGEDKSPIAGRREDKGAYITTVNTQTISETDCQEDSAKGKAEECVVDVLGINPAGLAFTAQVVVDPQERESVALGQDGLSPDPDVRGPRKTKAHGELQRHLVRGISETTTIVEKAENVGDAIPAKGVSTSTDSAFSQPDLVGNMKELSRRSRIASTEELRGRKGVVSNEAENDGSSVVTFKRTTADVSPQSADMTTSARAVSPGQAPSNNNDNRSLESIEQPKQDVNLSIQNDDRLRTAGTSPDHTRDFSPAHNVSRFAEQTEQLVTIQRVAQAIRLAHERNGEIRLRLHPPELGALRLQMRVQEGTLTARLEVETPAARDVLLDNLPSLRDRLAEHNIRVDNFDVALMHDGLGSQTGGREDFSGPRHPHWSRGSVPESQSPDGNREATEKIVARRLTNGQFDVVI